VAGQKQSLPEGIAEAIRKKYVEGGKVAVGHRLPTVLELARQYGTSTATITQSLALLDQAGLIDRRKGSGCYVAETRARRGLSVPGHLAFVAPNYSADIFVNMSHGVELACLRHGLSMVVAGSGHDYEAEREGVRRMIHGGAKAIVLSPISRDVERLRNDYLKSEFLDFPIVLLGSALEEQERPSVVFDNYRVGVDFAEYLIAEGHRYIAFVDDTPPGKPMTHLATKQRHAGLEDALARHGLVHRDEDHWPLRAGPDADWAGEAEKLVGNWLSQPKDKRATAVFGYFDHMAVQLIQAFQAKGVSVPDDIKVMGFDDAPFARSFHPVFPTTRPDFERAGEVAAELAIRWSEETNSRVLPRYILSVPVVFRE